jgi:endonuclease-3
MKKAAKARGILKILERLYPAPAAPLNHTDAYTLLISALLSGQSTDATVNRITPGLFRRASNPRSMSRLPVGEIRSMIKPCGLSPTKARHIRALSKILTEQHGGWVPHSFEALEALPGVGHKTASVVMAMAFHVPAFPVDTHIHRLAFRWGLSNGRSVEQTEADLKKLFPGEKWGRVHIQLIYYGRQYCPARGHRLERCAICRRYGVASRLGLGNPARAARRTGKGQ